MKIRKNWILALCLVFCLVLFGCKGTDQSGEDAQAVSEAQTESSGGESGSEDGSGDEEEEAEAADASDEEEDETADEADSPDDTDSGEDGETEFTDDDHVIRVFVMNEDASGFDELTVPVEEITPMDILGALINYGTVPEGTIINDFSFEGDNIAIDLSSDFQEAVFGLGSAGEYYLTGSVVNTFLTCYGAEGIKITIDGKPFETPGAGELTGYLGFYD